METIMLTFHRFAGDKNYLTKEDLRQLMEKEVPGYMEVSEPGARKARWLGAGGPRVSQAVPGC